MNLFDSLRQAADPSKAPSMRAYMRDQFDYLGIPTPVRRKLARTHLKAMAEQPIDWDFVDNCWRQPEREFQYLAVDYLSQVSAQLTPADLPRLRGLITTKSWWDTVDGLDTIVGALALRHPELNDTLLAWSLDDNIWLRRVAIDHQLSRQDQTDTSLLETVIVNNFGQKEFFINKAIGWALRQYARTDPDWVRHFIDRHRDRMASLSIREASKHL